jgi:phage terminase large subunit-like protein
LGGFFIGGDMARNERAEKVIRFVERYCLTPEGEHVGEPLKLAPFQRKFIEDVYRPEVRRAYLSIARKNGKSALIAALLLAHLVGPEAKRNSQIVSGARSRDQASLVFSLASKMVSLSPELSEIVRTIPSGKRLIGLPMNTEYRALAADSTTAHGLSPVLVILDEVGQVRGPRDEFIDALTTSQGAHVTPLLVAISTQSPTDADLFSLWLDDAKQHNDPRTVAHCYEAPEDCELTDPKAWKAANPALGLFRSLEDVKEQAEQAARMPSAESTFRNLTLNQRVAVLSPFVSKETWTACNGDPEPLGGQIFGGLDLSARTDLTALVLVHKHDDAWQVHPFFWTPEVGLHDRAKRDRVPYDLWVQQGYLRTTPGSTVDYEYVAQDIADILGDNRLQALAYDRWRISLFQKELERLGMELPLVPHGQGFRDMSPALDTLEAALLNAKLRHGGHPVLTMCAANAVVTKDAAGNRKLDKGKANGRIDGAVALAMALAAASGDTEEFAVGRLITL